MERQAAISFEVNRKRIGRVEEVLLEGESGDPAFPLLGRTRAQAPEVDGVSLREDKKGKSETSCPAVSRRRHLRPV